MPIDSFVVIVGVAFCFVAIVYIIINLCRKLWTNDVGHWIRFRCCQCLWWCERTSENRNSLFATTQSSHRRLEPCKLPELIIYYDAEPCVGETATFKITLPSSSIDRNVVHGNIAHTVHVQVPQQSRPTQNSMQMNSNIGIEIKKFSSLSSERISHIQEFGHDIESDEDFILIKYTVRESGVYQINVTYLGAHVKNSPHIQSFHSTELDPEKSRLLRQSPTVVALTDSPYSMLIEPKDRFGNECRFCDISASDFCVAVTHMDESFKNQPVEPIAYKFTVENFRDSILESTSTATTSVNVRLELEIFVAGFFFGKITYRDKSIGNGTFNVVCLTRDENQILSETLKKPPDSVPHKATLLAQNAVVEKSSTKVYLYVSQKLILVKTYVFLNLFPYRLGFYRILPATKIELLCVDLGSRDCTFFISDRNQPKLTMQMDTTSFRVFLAMFAHFMQQRLGGSESFENKQRFFYEELRQAREEKDREWIRIPVNRDDIVESSFASTRGFGVREWCRKSKVQFIGEDGCDDGGLRREWLTLLCKKLFEDNPNGLFCSFGNSRLVHPNLIRPKQYTLKHYEFAGKVVGKCIFETSLGGFNQIFVNARFSRSFLAHLVDSFPQHKHFETDDPELHLRKVKYILENDVIPMELNFQEEEYDRNTGKLLKTVDLIPNGKDIQVTNENKEEYISALAQFRLGSRTQSEIDAFRKGLHSIIPEGLLSNFDENELEVLMCGTSTFNVEDLKQNHVMTESGINARSVSKLLTWFWNSVEGMSMEERGRLLQFTTGSSLLPNGGFKDLRPTFRITISNTKGHLPVAHTCFSEICLSDHNSYEEFNKALKLAVNECSEGFAIT